LKRFPNISSQIWSSIIFQAPLASTLGGGHWRGRHRCSRRRRRSSDGRLKRFPNIGSQIWMMIFCCSGSGRGIDHQIYKIEEGDRVIEVMIKRISWPLMVMKRISRRR
jgi:hypothetical protein